MLYDITLAIAKITHTGPDMPVVSVDWVWVRALLHVLFIHLAFAFVSAISDIV